MYNLLFFIVMPEISNRASRAHRKKWIPPKGPAFRQADKLNVHKTLILIPSLAVDQIKGYSVSF